jgi:hypothetical protein
LSETQFTKIDWRPGKRRRTQPRVQHYAGQKEANPGFIAAGWLFGLHTPTAKRCTATARSTGRKCRRVAVTGSNVCMVHGGALALKRNRPYVLGTGSGSWPNALLAATARTGEPSNAESPTACSDPTRGA